MDELLYTAYLDDSLCLDQFGTWLHDGKPIQHPRIVDLFHKSVAWSEKEEKYYLVIGQGRASFSLQDTPYFVSALLDENNPWKIRLIDGSEEELSLESLCSGADDQIYCTVKNTHRARFLRSPHQRLLSYVVDDEHLQIGNQKVKLAQQ